MRSERGFDVFLSLWGAGAAFSAVAHLAAGRWMAAGTVWGHAQGWQSEIAFFDLCWFGIAVYGVAAGAYEFKKVIAFALTLLSALLGANHLAGLVRSSGLHLHVAGTLANAAAVAVGARLQFSARSRA